MNHEKNLKKNDHPLAFSNEPNVRRFGLETFLTQKKKTIRTQDLSDPGAFRTQTFSDPTIHELIRI